MCFELLLFWSSAWEAILRAILRAWPPLARQGGLAVPLFCNKNRFFNKNPVQDLLTPLKPTANIPTGFRFTVFFLATMKSLTWKFDRASLSAETDPPAWRVWWEPHSPCVPSRSAPCPAAGASSAAPCSATAAAPRQPRRPSVTRPAGHPCSGTVTSPRAPRTAGQPDSGRR